MLQRKVRPKWKEVYSRYQEVEKEIAEKPRGVLRFGKPFVAASEISDQKYCEKKLEFTILNGEEETPEKIEGTKAHEQLLRDTVKVRAKEGWKQIFRGEAVFFREFYVAARVNGHAVIGKIDGILFRSSIPRLVIEHKFSSSLLPYDTYQVQAQVYCLILQNMGFGVSELEYVIVVAPRGSKNDLELRKVLQHIGANPKKEIVDIPLGSDFARAYVYKYDPIRAGREYEDSLEYLVGEAGCKRVE